MPSNNPYQTPKTKLETKFLENDDVKLWMPQAAMLAEKGKTEGSIQHFLKMKGIEEKYITDAARYAYQKGQRDNIYGRLPYTIVGWALIIGSLTWLTYTLINYRSFMFILLFPIALGYGLVKGVYLRDRK